jgi:adenylate cyclase class 2
MRSRLKDAGASMQYPERLMRRRNFYPPEETAVANTWVRVRDEGDRVTMSIKQQGTRMEDQKETQLVIDSFDAAAAFLNHLGCRDKNYQETRREMWRLDGCEIAIDEWPFIEPLVEIEGASEEAVRAVSAQLGFDWNEAIFATADKLYARKYGIEPRAVNRHPHLTFDRPNPFLGKSIGV